MEETLAQQLEPDFSQWDPVAYLREYFPATFDPDQNEPALKFFVEQRHRLGDAAELIEVGTGPTVYHLLPLAPVLKRVVVADFLPANLEQIRLWVEKSAEAYSWEVWTHVLLGYEGLAQSTAEIQKRENLLRQQITDYWLCDVRLPDPLGPDQRGQWSAVLSCYCADSITANLALWRTFMINILSLVAPGGIFLGGALKQASFYWLDGKRYPSAGVTEDDFVQLLQELGYEEIVAESSTIIEQGYEGIVLVAARAPWGPQ